MNNVARPIFGGTAGYDEALFRQALRKEIRDNGGELTHACIERAFEDSLEVAPTMKTEDPKAFKDYIDITYILLERERDIVDDEDWNP